MLDSQFSFGVGGGVGGKQQFSTFNYYNLINSWGSSCISYTFFSWLFVSHYMYMTKNYIKCNISEH